MLSPMDSQCLNLSRLPFAYDRLLSPLSALTGTVIDLSAAQLCGLLVLVRM